MRVIKQIQAEPVRKLKTISEGGGGGTSDHKKLVNRDLADQHPIGAITQLMEELSVRPAETLTNTDIQNILNR